MATSTLNFGRWDLVVPRYQAVTVLATSWTRDGVTWTPSMNPSDWKCTTSGGYEVPMEPVDGKVAFTFTGGLNRPNLLTYWEVRYQGTLYWGGSVKSSRPTDGPGAPLAVDVKVNTTPAVATVGVIGGSSGGAAGGSVTSVAGKVGAVSLVVEDVAGAVWTSDSRLSNPRPPTAHGSNHGTGGSDPITPASIGASASNHLHDDRYALIGGSGGGAHAATHATGGADAVTPASIGAATEGHNHDSQYSAATHLHDDRYALIGSGGTGGPHASTHATGGSDPLTPADIGAATAAQGTKADDALPATTYTASDILNRIKTVDGLNSGLDADRVRGEVPTPTGMNVLKASTPGNARMALEAANAYTANVSTVGTNTIVLTNGLTATTMKGFAPGDGSVLVLDTGWGLYAIGAPGAHDSRIYSEQRTDNWPATTSNPATLFTSPTLGPGVWLIHSLVWGPSVSSYSHNVRDSAGTFAVTAPAAGATQLVSWVFQVPAGSTRTVYQQVVGATGLVYSSILRMTPMKGV